MSLAALRQQRIKQMPQVTNLDAHIPREDFLADQAGAAGQRGKESASSTDLSIGESFYMTLRKPDFQRETAAWSPEAVRDCIVAFLQGDLIPAVICWQSSNRLTFVIDGAHRLSAIVAWIHNDYGKGTLSNKFYGHAIDKQQEKIALKTQALVDEAVGGTYANVKEETRSPGTHPQLAEAALSLGNASIPLLWVKSSEAKKAEKAFFTINRAAVEIDPTELRILQTRFSPAARTARTVVRNATGHNYWGQFTPDGQRRFVEAAKNLNTLLYRPPLEDTIRSLDLPVAGHGFGTQTLPLVFDLVNIANEFPIIDASKIRASFRARKKTQAPPEQEQLQVTEADALKCVRQTKGLIDRLTGRDSSSLGLHAAIYFYSSNGRHQPTAVLAVADMVATLVKRDLLNSFCDVRATFEDFLIEHKMFINQLTTKYGSMAKGYKVVRDYMLFVVEKLIDGTTASDVSKALKDDGRFQILVKEKPVKSAKAKDFSKEAAQFIFLKAALEKALVCPYCRARVDTKAMNLDHIKDKKHGGMADDSNGEFTHPYCNSAYKDYLRKNDRLPTVNTET